MHKCRHTFSEMENKDNKWEGEKEGLSGLLKDKGCDL